jgi:hypothetical protein
MDAGERRDEIGRVVLPTGRERRGHVKGCFASRFFLAGTRLLRLV